MREVVLASVRTYARRYVAAVVAVVVGVGFIVTTDALGSAARNGLLADVAASYPGAEQVLTGFDDFSQAGRTITRAEEAGVPATLNALTVADLVHGEAPPSRDVTVGTQSTEGSLRWQQLTRGRFAARAGQAVMDVHAAEAQGVAVGDEVTLRQDGAGRTVTVTGLVDAAGVGLGADVYLTRTDIVALDNPTIVVEAVLGGDAAAAERVAAQLSAALPDQVVTRSAEQFLTDRQTELLRGVNVVQLMLLTFAAIALFVAVMVIANTFTVLLAQRRQDFALLRCVGATRRQVMRSVYVEALVVGMGASTLGVLGGVALGRALTAVGANLLDSTLPLAGVEHSPLWLAGAWGTGVAATLLASVLPARRSTRTTPLAALRPEAVESVRTRAGALRIASGALFVVPGVALLSVAMDRHELPLMIAGGFVSFLGVLLLGPLLVPAAIRVVGAVLGRLLGVPGTLAASNAVRNPRRTAATAAALLVGVTLITGMVTGMATVRTTVAEEMDAQYPIDATLTAADALPAAAVKQVAVTDGVAQVVEVSGASARVGASDGPIELGDVTLLAVGPSARSVAHGDAAFLAPAPDELVVPWDLLAGSGLGPDASVEVRTGAGTATLRVVGADGLGEAVAVAPATLRALAPDDTATRALWVRAEGGADPGDLVGALETVAGAHDAAVSGGLEQRDFVDLQLDVMLGAVLTLLAVSVLIALVGVGSTLGLSVLERTREHALLRALGLSRRQLRGTLAAEAVLLAGVAGVLGVLLGVGYAWVGVRTMIAGVVDDVTLVVPVGQLVAVVAVAAVAGLAAGVLPARRAARVSPAAGLTAD
jgi:putative ABC transport system permease protein